MYKLNYKKQKMIKNVHKMGGNELNKREKIPKMGVKLIKPGEGVL